MNIQGTLFPIIAYRPTIGQKGRPWRVQVGINFFFFAIRSHAERFASHEGRSA